MGRWCFELRILSNKFINTKHKTFPHCQTFIISFFSVNQFYLNKIKQKDFQTFGWNQGNNIVSVTAKCKESCQILRGNNWSDGFLIFQHSSQKNSSSQAIWLFQSATAWFMFFFTINPFFLVKIKQNNL